MAAHPAGDDAAVVEPVRGTLEVLTTDTLVESIHFDFSFCSPADVGVKAVAVNLSDLAAMGAEPRAALVSLSVPQRMTREALEELIDALVSTAKKHCLTVAGGNITSSPGPLVVTITATGSVRPRRALLRSGARPGDAIYVSAAIGAAAAGLGMLREGRTPAGETKRSASGDTAPRGPGATGSAPRPHPRRDRMHRLERRPGRRGQTRRRGQRCGRAARGGCRFLSTRPPGGISQREGRSRHRGAGRRRRLRAAVHVSAEAARRLAAAVRRSPGLAVTRIGVVTKEPDVRLRRDGRDEPLPEGFQHF